MASISDLLTDIDLRYRNSFTPAQKLIWMNEEQIELFETLEIDSSPVSFPLQADVYFYPIPAGVDVDRIKTATIQVNDDTDNPEFQELPFRKNDDRQFVNYTGLYYSLVGESFFIPNGVVEDRQVYIYFDEKPTELTTANMGVEPSIPARYQEILKLGTLERIAEARKDVVMKNNYAAEKEQKIVDMEWKMKMNTPEFDTPIDTLPRFNRNRTNRRTQYITITS